jgi:hypothetical protein
VIRTPPPQRPRRWSRRLTGVPNRSGTARPSHTTR